MATYYIFGKDDLLIREKVEECLALPEYSRHFAGELSFDGLIEIISATDLFALEEAHWIDGVKALGISKSDVERLEKAIRECAPNKFVAFSQNTNFKDWRDVKKYESSAAHKLLDEAASETYNLTKLTYPNVVVDWTRARARKHGLVISYAGAEIIAEASAHLPQLVDAELRKIALLKKSDKLQEVPESLIKKHIFPIPAERIFSYLDALLERRDMAVDMLAEIFELGGSASGVLAMAFKKLKLISQCIDENPYNVPEVKRMYPSLKTRFIAQVNGWERDQIARALELVGETDFRLKTAGVPDYDLLATFTVEVMNL
ncbi:hypothetical protein J7K50_06210 [bacterium]|nr:hypothetical protein [bacterium]